MPTVGTINIDLRMGTAAVVSGANKAAGSIAAMAKSIVGSIKSIGTSIVPTISVEGLVGSIKNIATAQAGAIDTVAKLSDRLGITTEAYVGMAHAADLAGVANEEFGGMLEKLQKNIGVANEDGGKTIDVLKGLGLNMRDISQQNIGETFMQIADAVEKIPDPTKRAQVMFELFGRSGQQLTNTMMSGGKSIREAMKEAAALGMTFSRLDAAKVEAANDAFTRLKGSIAGVGNTITIGLAPFIEQLNKSITAFIATSGQDFAKVIVNGIISAVDAAQIFYAALLRVGVKLGEIMAGVGSMMNQVGNSGLAKTLGIGDMRGAGMAVANAGNSLALNSRVAANDADKAPRWSQSIVDTATAAAKDVVSQLAKSTITEQVFGGLFKSFDALKSKGVEAGSAIAKAFSPLADKLREAGKATTEKFMSPMEKFKKENADLERQFRAGVISKDTFDAAKAASYRDLQGSQQQQAVSSPSLAVMGTAGAFSAMAQIRNQGRGGDSIKDVFKESVKQTNLQKSIDQNQARMVDAFLGTQVVNL